MQQALLASAALALWCACARAEETPRLTIASWGGAYQAAQQTAFYQPFSERQDIAISSVLRGPASAAMPAEASSSWDVVELFADEVKQGCTEGLLQPLPLSQLGRGNDGTPAREDFFPDGLLTCGVANGIWAERLAYFSRLPGNTEPVGPADFFDTRRFPGPRALRRNPQGALEWALLADGVDTAEVYALLATDSGVERALGKLATLPDLRWWDTPEQAREWLANAEVAMASLPSEMLFSSAVVYAEPVQPLTGGTLWRTTYWAIPKNAPNKSIAWQFVRFASGSHPMAERSNHLPHGPTRYSAQALIQAEIRPYLPLAEGIAKSDMAIDRAFWQAHGAALRARFADWMVRDAASRAAHNGGMPESPAGQNRPASRPLINDQRSIPLEVRTDEIEDHFAERCADERGRRCTGSRGNDDRFLGRGLLQLAGQGVPRALYGEEPRHRHYQ
jgi:putative spermidine/putrescine transport system substrate-binding protein